MEARTAEALAMGASRSLDPLSGLKESTPSISVCVHLLVNARDTASTLLRRQQRIQGSKSSRLSSRWPTRATQPDLIPDSPTPDIRHTSVALWPGATVRIGSRFVTPVALRGLRAS